MMRVYYDSSGKLIFVNSGQISPDGTTSLSFSHASDYVIVIEKTDRKKLPVKIMTAAP
jgi:hypothetical protein